MKDTPSARLALLNSGAGETTTLTECLAVDFAALMKSAVPEAEAAYARRIAEDPAAGVTRRMAFAGEALLAVLGIKGAARLGRHPSDTVRGWACYAIAAGSIPFDRLLRKVRPFADDPHFGVREWAWLAIRSHLSREIELSIRLLVPWTASKSERLRRFASEATRPRGVWSAHIAALRQNPALGLPILEPLRSDPAKYVQNSVSNWLNDAAKDHPDWVRGICARWTAQSPTPQTKRICARAQRSLGSPVLR